MTVSIDAYTLRARLLPALVTIAPALVLIFTLVLATQSQSVRLLGLVAILSLLYLFSTLAEALGQMIEPKVFARAGGTPWTSMLRQGDVNLPAETKRRILDFCAMKIGRAAPSKQEEADNVVAANAFYAACSDKLREVTGGREHFPELFEAQEDYGFRRNLLGLKSTGLMLNVIVVLVSVAQRSTAARPQHCLTTSPRLCLSSLSPPFRPHISWSSSRLML